MSIYEQMKAAGVEIDHHETDLYVPVTPVTTFIVNNYEHFDNVSTFKSQIDSTFWYDIPFAYTPAWERKLR